MFASSSTASSSMIDSCVRTIRGSNPHLETRESNAIQLQGIKATQSRGFYCQSMTGRKAVPWPAIQQAWFEKRCYIPKTNRTCEEHLTISHKLNDDALRMIDDLKQEIFVKLYDFGFWLNAISDLPTTSKTMESSRKIQHFFRNQ